MNEGLEEVLVELAHGHLVSAPDGLEEVSVVGDVPLRFVREQNPLVA
jgi:hypothetical protein